MRTRNNKIEIKLSDKEYEDFKKKVSKVGTTKSDYIRRLIMHQPLKERPDARFFDVLNQLLKIENNLGQIANKAEFLNLSDKDYYRNEQRKCGKLFLDIRKKYL